MSWQPPPSFAPEQNRRRRTQSKETTTSTSMTTTTTHPVLDQQSSRPGTNTNQSTSTGSPRKDDKQSSRRKTWSVSPAFVVGAEADAALEDPSPHAVNVGATLQAKPPKREMSPARTSPNTTTGCSPGATSTSAGTTTTTTSSTPKPAATLRKVGWNRALFIVDREGVSAPEEEARGADSPDGNDGDGEYDVIQVPSRANLGLDKNYNTQEHQSFARKRDLLVVDQAMLRTRLEWSQLLVSKAFKPYRKMICAIDDDLPDPNDIEEMEEAASNDDYLDGNKELVKIRDQMLDDSDLNEKLIAAFFEGYKLFQMKVNSLQIQLEGMKAMQKSILRSTFTTTSNTSNTASSLPSIAQRHHPSATEIKGSNDRRTNTAIPSSFEPLAVLQEEDKKPLSGKTAPPTVTTIPKIMVPTTTTTTTQALNLAPIPVPVPAPPAANDCASKATATGTSSCDSASNPSKRQTPIPPPVVPPPHKSGVEPPRSIRQMSIQRIREATNGNEDIGKLLAELEEAWRRQKKLEKQLAHAGVVIADDIPYDIAKEKVANIARRMGEIGGSDVDDWKLQEEYFLLEREMEKYTTALQLTDEWIAEQKEMERQWEESVIRDNEEAIQKIRRHMPVNVRNMSEAQLTTARTPNGKYLPETIAKKFKRTNVLQLLRIDPDDIVRMHPSTLENLRVTGLTLTERRALYHHLKDVGPRWKAMQGERMTERKWTWFAMMKSNLKENVDIWHRHVNRYGPPGDHPYATSDDPQNGCPLIGKQCPLKADKMIDYEGDYGFPEDPEYFKSDVDKSEVDDVSKAKHEAHEAIKQEKSEERSTALKKHYNGKIFQVSLANGSCELMDEAMDNMEDVQEKWIKARISGSIEASTDGSGKREMAGFNEALNELKFSILQLAERSGMQLTGKRDVNADQPDTRSMIEVSLCEEVIETAFDFFEGIEERIVEMDLKDGRMRVAMEQLRTLLEEIQERNRHVFESLDQERPPRSRELKSRSTIAAHVNAAAVEEEVSPVAEDSTSSGSDTVSFDHPARGKGSGNALSEVKAGGGRVGGSGRADSTSALQDRGHVVAGGREGLMAAIAGRASLLVPTTGSR